MNEEELLLAHHVGDVISIIQRTTHHLFDPDDLLTVSASYLIYHVSLGPSFVDIIFYGRGRTLVDHLQFQKMASSSVKKAAFLCSSHLNPVYVLSNFLLSKVHCLCT